jgi:hypothetical protein
MSYDLTEVVIVLKAAGADADIQCAPASIPQLANQTRPKQRRRLTAHGVGTVQE